MDTERFDRMTVALTDTRSRRGVLRLLTGSALAGGLAVLGGSAAEAKRKKKMPRDMCPVSRPAPNAPRCGGAIPGEDCTCNKAVEGNNVCIAFIESCSVGGEFTCTSTRQCVRERGFHFVCQAAGAGSCGQVCLPTCDAPDTQAAGAAKSKRAGKNANAF